ncbi:MAG TPA: hypothetical protein DD620_05340 [Verrucomicrobia bacterium]|nr:hypothetical protein [Verrucomicrobiota bacterium]
MRHKRTNQNRRRQEVRVPFPTILVGVLTLSVVIGAGYMSINIRCSGLGKQIKLQERALIETQKRLMVEQDKWSSRTAPINLERALAHHGLKMEMPESRQVMRIEAWKESKDTLAINSRNSL